MQEKTNGKKNYIVMIHKIVTDETAQDTRLDQWLSQAVGDLSRSRLQDIIRNGGVWLDGKQVTQARLKLRAGQEIVVEMPNLRDSVPEPQNMPLDILYEDRDIIVVNKPSGLVVHPGNGNPDGTLVNALLYHCGDSLSGIGGVRRPGIVHRLDKDTSGVLVVAKNDVAHQHLSAQFADHGRSNMLERCYKAVIWGVPPHVSGRIETYLGRDARVRTRQAVVDSSRPDARHAVTHFKLVQSYGNKARRKKAGEGKMRINNPPIASLVECRLETGRTHQIRVHMAHIGHPLIGDDEYGRGLKSKINLLTEDVRQKVESFSRQALHACSLQFTHPKDGQILHFTAPLPDDMVALTTALQALDGDD